MKAKKVISVPGQSIEKLLKILEKEKFGRNPADVTTLKACFVSPNEPDNQFFLFVYESA